MWRAQGLTNITAEAFARVVSGSSAYGRFLYLGRLPFRDSYAALRVTEPDMDQFLALLLDPEFAMLSPLLILVRAQRPAACLGATRTKFRTLAATPVTIINND